LHQANDQGSFVPITSKKQLMATEFEAFKNLHYTKTPFLLGNVWDVRSAKTLEKLGYQALGTSSAAVAATLGYADGQNMPFEEYLFIVERIKKSTNLPFSVDIEFGYGETVEAIVNNIIKLQGLGVIGINIEDSLVVEGKRVLEDAAVFQQKLANITQRLEEKSLSMFINVRCDAFLLNLPNTLEEAISRVKLYENTGVDGIFLPCITSVSDINAVISITRLPLNVMAMPNLPDFQTLQEVGVKRVSVGNFVHDYVFRQMEQTCLKIEEKGSFSALFRQQ
jgi:2-methylisocitrate lyase-like PEP mutase family enzyme